MGEGEYQIVRLVLDTNIVISSLFWNGAPKRLFDLCDERRIALFASTDLLLELADVLSRQKLAHKIVQSGLSSSRIMQMYSTAITLVEPIEVSGIAPDPKDDMVIGAALAANADFIVTGDIPLLSVAEYKGIRFITVAEALQEVSLL